MEINLVIEPWHIVAIAIAVYLVGAVVTARLSHGGPETLSDTGWVGLFWFIAVPVFLIGVILVFIFDIGRIVGWLFTLGMRDRGK